MGFSCGIVGLPNVGKSTLFNALTKANVPSSNYPFCTIEPNVGIVEVYDERVENLAKISNSQRKIFATVRFVDIAGLVKGASKGEGLGNQFLSNIRDVDAIIQVVRLFHSPDVVHIGDIDPIRDIEIINTELILKDLEFIEKSKEKLSKISKTGDKDVIKELEVLEKLYSGMSEGRLARTLLSQEEIEMIEKYQLLTTKPMLIVANIDEKFIGREEKDENFLKLEKYAREVLHSDVLPLSAKIESEIAELSVDEAKVFLNELGLKLSGLQRLAIEGYKLLDLITFFTTGEKETRAWTIKRGTNAQKAAGKIHSDMEKGFIRAEVIHYDEFIKIGSWTKAKEEGKIRLEGKDYIVQDGDIMIIRFNV
ncbi:MAG: redox-regulated ATPase YchF [Brevinematia bacterium]